MAVISKIEIRDARFPLRPGEGVDAVHRERSRLSIPHDSFINATPKLQRNELCDLKFRRICDDAESVRLCRNTKVAQSKNESDFVQLSNAKRRTYDNAVVQLVQFVRVAPQELSSSIYAIRRIGEAQAKLMDFDVGRVLNPYLIDRCRKSDNECHDGD